MQLSSQIKHQSKESDRLSIFFGQFPRRSFPISRVGLYTATPQSISFPTLFPGFPFLSLLQSGNQNKSKIFKEKKTA